MANILEVFKRIQNLQKRYHEASVGKESLVKMLYESEVAEQVYNSNAIENSTLTFEETDKIKPIAKRSKPFGNVESGKSVFNQIDPG